jgi:hypothetical protein
MIRYICQGLLFTMVGAIGLLSISGCTNEGDVLAPSEFAPPSNFKASSGDARVFLSWTATTSSVADDFAGYRVVTKSSSGTVMDSTNTGPTATSYTVAGLTNGGIYNFTIQSVKDDGSVSENVTVQWGPTARFGFQSLYEFASLEASGLDFSPGQRFNFTIANQGVIDLWIDGRSGATPLLKSPDTYVPSAGWRHTRFVETNATSFDEQVDVPDVSAFRSTPGLSIVSGKVYFAITADGNYVKFRVESPGVQVDPANNMRFVNITVAYNTGGGHWAKTVPVDAGDGG